MEGKWKGACLPLWPHMLLRLLSHVPAVDDRDLHVSFKMTCFGPQ